MCLAQKENNQSQDSSRGRVGRIRHGIKNNRDNEDKYLQGGENDLHYICLKIYQPCVIYLANIWIIFNMSLKIRIRIMSWENGCLFIHIG